MADTSSITNRLMDAVGNAQNLALSMTRQATSFAAERLPAVPGFPANLLDTPRELVDKVFEQIEGAVGEKAPLVRDVLQQQSTFVKGVFDSLDPIVDALAGDEGTTGGTKA